MSDETLEPETQTEPKKRKPGYSSRMALLEVIERKKREDRIDYRTIAQKHGISCNALRHLYCDFRKGKIELGRPETLIAQEVDARLQQERKIGLLRRHQEMILNIYEGMLFKAGDAVVGKRGYLAYEKVGLAKLLRELKSLTDLIGATEKGYMAIIDEYKAAHANQEKQANARPVDVVSTKIAGANDEHLAMQALGGLPANGA